MKAIRAELDGTTSSKEQLLAKDNPVLSHYKISDWRVDPATNGISQGEEVVKLEPKVMNGAQDHLHLKDCREELEAAVWAGIIVGYDTLTGVIQKLRRAFKDDPRNPRFIETVSKKGYRLVAPVIHQIEPSGSIKLPTADGISAKTRTPGTKVWPIALLIVLLAGFGALFWFNLWETSDNTLAPDSASRFIAVLPFENLSGNPEKEYFADGITEYLITDLSKLAGLRVVARNSAFAYKGSTETEQQIGLELRARYIVRGNVRRAEDRLRINVRLTDTRAGSNRWAERYDRQISDIFHLQDEITHRIVSALQVELSSSERQRLVKDYTTSIEAYDWYLRGLDHYGRRSGEDNMLAKEFFESAIAIEPDFARAYAGLALTYSINSINGWGLSLEKSLAQAESLALKASQLDENLPQAHFVMGEVEMYRHNHVDALDELAQAIELKPSYADAYALLAWVLHFAGRPEEGLAAMDKAIDLNPRVPGAYRMVQGALRYELEEIAEAVRMLELAVESNPNYQLARVFLAASYAAAGQSEAANWQVMEVLALNPDFSLTVVERGSPIRDPIYKERFLRDLQRAGLSY